MTTAKQIRASLTSCVDEALKDVPGSGDISLRLRCFIAYLSGELGVYGEDAVVASLRRLVGPVPAGQQPADGA